MSLEADLQAAAEDDAVITGTEETVKHISDVDTVVVAANTPADLEERVRDAADDADVPVQTIDADHVELGALCMKPYTASVVGITER